VRTRNVVVLLVVVAAVIGLVRRRSESQFVEVQFEDGSSVRLGSGPEARDLLEDAYAVAAIAR
jgi:hypothetical protein